jgi:hypothetical protein
MKIQNLKSNICKIRFPQTRHQLLVTRHSGIAAFQHSKSKIQNSPLPAPF